MTSPPLLSSLSAPGGGEGWGEVGDSRRTAAVPAASCGRDARGPAKAHLTLPIAARWVPSLSALKGGEGKFSVTL
jgi:hypothetical protein